MEKKEFIDLLINALDGRVPSSLINEKAGYYRDYITQTAREHGESEEEVIQMIGSPEAIAFTIIEVYEDAHGPYDGHAYSGPFRDGGSASRDGAYTSRDGGSYRSDFDEYGERKGPDGLAGVLESIKAVLSGQYGCLILALIALVIVIGVVSWVLKFMAAYPLLAVVIFLTIAINRNKRNRR